MGWVCSCRFLGVLVKRHIGECRFQTIGKVEYLDEAAIRLCDQLARDHQRVFPSKLKRPWLVSNGNTLCLQEMRMEPGVQFPPNSVRLNAFVSLWRDLGYTL